MSLRWGKYNIIDTKSKLEALDDHLMEGDSPKFSLMAYDTETNGLQLYKSVVIGYSLSTDSKSGFYIPLLTWVPDPASEKIRSIAKVKRPIFEHGEFECIWTGKRYPEFITPNLYQPPEFIKKYVKRWFSKVNLIMHNAPFDVNMSLVNFGVDLADNVLMDTALLAHILNENSPNALKAVAAEWKKELGFDPYVDAAMEQKELGESIIRNGGVFNARNKTVWRANLEPMGKYACADTFLTFGVYEVGMEKFLEEFGEEKLDWLFEDEVMPVCKEVVIPMKRKGVYVDVPYFEQLKIDTAAKLEQLEDEIMAIIGPDLEDFDIGDNIEEAVSQQRLIKRIIQLEGLTMPTKYDKKTDTHKETLGKPVIKKLYQTDPHWLWGYMLGEDELKYSDARLAKIKMELYQEIIGRRYRFNIKSDAHLRWYFCDKYKMDKSKLPQTDSATKANPIPSMAAEVLEEHMLSKFEWVKLLMLYKKIQKLQSTYIEPAVNLNIDGWLYMDMKQNGTISGRFACSGGFNLQTLPKVEEVDTCPKCKAKLKDGDIVVTQPHTLLATITCKKCKHVEENILCPSAIKRGFIAPPGYKIVNADYSSLEPRCFAFVSGDEKLKQIYWDDLDMYSKVYCDMMKEKYVDLKKSGRTKERDLVKPVILGIPYGARNPQVANLMGLKKKKKFRDKKTGTWIEKEVLDVEKGEEYRNLYLNTYKKLHKYMIRQELASITKGYVTTLIGRRRHFQYAPFIYELLSAYSITVDEFLDARYDTLTSHTNGLGLDKEGLELFCKRYKKELWEVMEKGAWAHVRELFKNEYNGAKNYPIQGLAGHICNMGMRDTTRLFKENKIDGWIFLQVHDEVSTYIKISQTEIGAKLQKQGMEENKYAKMIDIAMVANPLVCDNLKDSK
jgi:DNA polymerase I-like protein with 3'-5' exonuclease and polymerase domains